MKAILPVRLRERSAFCCSRVWPGAWLSVLCRLVYPQERHGTVLSDARPGNSNAGLGSPGESCDGCFAILFGFAMGADYMLIPLVAADCLWTFFARKDTGADHHVGLAGTKLSGP